MFLSALLNSGCQSIESHYQLTDHPLNEKLWFVKDKRFKPESELMNQLAQYQVIFLGETHDNRIHHRLQSKMIDKLGQQQPAVAFEMLNQDQQPQIDSFLQQARTSNSLDSFAQHVNWEDSGWPDWSYYRPVFEPVFRHSLPIIASNLDIAIIRNVIRKGTEQLAPPYPELLAKYTYQPQLQQQMQQEIADSHCNMLPEKYLAPMVKGQQLRDLALMQSVKQALLEKPQHPVIMVAGSGHTRTDFGVPYYLHQEHPGIKTLSIAFIEVSEELLKAEDYLSSWGEQQTEIPFDIIWFTARAEREDPCEKMAQHMKKKANN